MSAFVRPVQETNISIQRDFHTQVGSKCVTNNFFRNLKLEHSIQFLVAPKTYRFIMKPPVLTNYPGCPLAQKLSCCEKHNHHAIVTARKLALKTDTDGRNSLYAFFINKHEISNDSFCIRRYFFCFFGCREKQSFVSEVLTRKHRRCSYQAQTTARFKKMTRD